MRLNYFKSKRSSDSSSKYNSHLIIFYRSMMGRLKKQFKSDRIAFREVFQRLKIVITDKICTHFLSSLKSKTCYYTGGILFNPDLAVEEVFHVLSSTF